MAATVSLPPPEKALHQDHIWLKLQSSLVAVQNSHFRITGTGANAAGETLGLTFGGTTVTFTTAAVPDSSGTQVPQRIAQDDETYHAELAEAISQNQLITDTFTVYAEQTGGTWRVWLMARERTALAVGHAHTLANTEVTGYSSTGLYLEPNLRALVEVYRDTGSPATDSRLGQQHAPYTADRLALFDLSPHFAGFEPSPPWSGTLNGFHERHEPSMYLNWYFRYADKHGTPATAEAMARQPGGTVFFGSHSAAALTDYAAAPLKHVTAQKNGMPFWKPVGEHQPDWSYYFTEETRPDYSYLVTIHYTDGSDSAFQSGTFHLTTGRLYSFTTGMPQLNIEGQADPDKTIARYSFSLVDPADTHYFTRRYQLICECHRWGHILLYTNGTGGMETVWLDGKQTEKFNTTKAYARRTRTDNWQLADGDLQTYDQQGSPSWTASTGWYEDTNYLDHLRQLPLAARCWIIDLQNSRYLPVHVSPGEIQTNEDDRDLQALELTITAAWLDQNSNI